MIFLFTFILYSGERILLTSANEEVRDGDYIYFPNSGLSIKSIQKANGMINCMLTGFFEESGITNTSLLESSFLKIVYYEDACKIIKNFTYLEFFLAKYDNGSFEIQYRSTIHHLNKPIISEINNHCRANLGDKDCGVDLKNFLEEVKLLSIDKNKIMIYKSIKPPGYFNGGMVKFENNVTSKILLFNQTEFFIEDELEIVPDEKLILYPSCNKSFRQCVGRFANGVNFRGEPFIGK